MPDRREVLKVAGAGIATMAMGRSSFGAPADPTWLSYAIHAERFWKGLPFLDRLRKVSEVGFSRYEFWRWRTKDIEAIAKLNEELGLQAILFTGYRGIHGPKWKEGLLDSVADAAELAPRLGAAKLGVDPPELDPNRDREEQVEDLVDALKEAAEKVAEFEVTLILETAIAGPGRSGKPLLVTPGEAAAVVKAVGSPRVKFAFECRRRGGDGENPLDQIKKFQDQIGHYRLCDLGRPAIGVDDSHVLKAIHDAGHADPIGLVPGDRVDPMLAIDDLRKADAAAKAL